jgi:hypothetical protein
VTLWPASSAASTAAFVSSLCGAGAVGIHRSA